LTNQNHHDMIAQLIFAAGGVVFRLGGGACGPGQAAARSRLSFAVAATVFCGLAAACARMPSEPSRLPIGQWSGGGACLSVADQGCDFVAGCGHGRFPAPEVARDGTFTVIGTYRIEAGPIGLDPPPPATFSGVVTGSTLALTIAPADTPARPMSYLLRLTGGSGRCGVLCL
jgi:hypothetical protein